MNSESRTTRRNFIYSLIGLSFLMLPVFGKLHSIRKPDKKREEEFYELSCFLTGFDQLDRTMNHYVLLEMIQLFSIYEVDKILHSFVLEKKYPSLKAASRELNFFHEALLKTWYSGNFSLKVSQENLVALGYLHNLTWASYSIPAPGIPSLSWEKPILN